jgi:predicted  nucleic acid-binding Zn-ribbon protein
MDQSTPPELLAHAPQRETDLVDQAGHRIVALLREAADISAENIERAMNRAHKTSMELRAAEERITLLEAEVERLRDRATRAEGWLEAIKREIEDKLIASMEANRPELSALH